jgi:hypothetical protein
MMSEEPPLLHRRQRSSIPDWQQTFLQSEIPSTYEESSLPRGQFLGENIDEAALTLVSQQDHKSICEANSERSRDR